MSLWKIGCWVSLFSLLGVLGPFERSATANASGRRSERMVRIVWQDREEKTLRWGEFVQVGPRLLFRTGGEVQGFPSLKKERQELVQMQRMEDILVVGVRDDDDGQFQSGWAAVDLGVDEIPHGDHSDYEYRNHPRVLATQLDKSQGNPAHLYLYDGQFYLANDRLDGFTRFVPKALRGPVEGRRGTFYRGGGGHITLAAVDNQVAYSTWIGGGATNGQVDVVDLSKNGEKAIAYSFHLPSGGLHGAIANSGRVFFAPSDGIYWVDADLNLQSTAETVKPNHLSLGEDAESDRPLRTGAFVNHRNWVMFTTGKMDQSALCLVDAAASKPKVIKVPIKTADGLSLITPETVVAANGKRYAFVFQNKKEGEVREKLTIIDLDPNRDRDFSDAAIAKTLDVGASQVEGHYGHHSIAFDDDKRFGILTNPGDGEIWLLSLNTLSVIGKHKVGGMPTKVLAVGGEASKH
ncbi:hypothetical protein [Thalassoroseus pseudoceratinae]|uniref:hypothetical protein n=1 Tax=Thalassoroseus pseudoceratinae TaxID=2713176 RepID=UPI0014225F06|nr:hypothetical protein [Thalassoroseus pseudoceratinae]